MGRGRASVASPCLSSLDEPFVSSQIRFGPTIGAATRLSGLTPDRLLGALPPSRWRFDCESSSIPVVNSRRRLKPAPKDARPTFRTNDLAGVRSAGIPAGA
jgi:hypothetical protein